MSEVRSHTGTASEFEAAVGSPPLDDELERANCDKAGQIGHSHCGWCPIDNKPRFICGHSFKTDDLQTSEKQA